MIAKGEVQAGLRRSADVLQTAWADVTSRLLTCRVVVGLYLAIASAEV